MISIDNPLLVFVGVPVMALVCWTLSRWFPLLDGEARAHANSLPLDGLRGVLASSVFFHHSFVTYVYMHTGAWIEPQSPFYAQLGPAAVTMFFFLSGYLFWGKMLKDPMTLRPARLWPNRLRRILPAYWSAILLAFVVAAVATRFRLHESGTTLASSALQWVLVGFPCLPDLNGMVQERLTGGVFWTLRTELIFYLLLPALVWFRRGWRIVLLLAAALLVNRGLHRMHPQSELLLCTLGDLQRFTTSLVASFSVGMVAAYQPWKRALSVPLRSSWFAVLCALFLVAELGFVPAGYTWYEPLLLAPVFFAVAAGNSFFGLLTSRPLRCLGQVSYSLYIFHGVLLFVLTSAWNHYVPVASMDVLSYWGLILCIGGVVAAFCTLTYWFIERPFLPVSARLPNITAQQTGKGRDHSRPSMQPTQPAHRR